MRKLLYFLFLFVLITVACKKDQSHLNILNLQDGQSVVTIGGNLCSRMAHYDYFQAYLHTLNKGKKILYRNMCDGGDTPGFRPHSGRYSPWAFPGAEKFQTEFANSTGSEGHLESPDQWLSRYKADVILGFFGYSESIDGPDSLARHKAELEAFINHTKAQKYNGKSAPRLILVSPIAFENLSSRMDVPDGSKENKNLAAYTAMMSDVAQKNNIDFIDMFYSTKEIMSADDELTIDGAQLNDAGYKKFATILINKLFGKNENEFKIDEKLMNMIKDKNWFWTNLFKIPNGVHVFGRRYNPYGQDNYPFELKKMDEMTYVRDTAIWSLVNGSSFNIAAADARTTVIPNIKTNYIPASGQKPRYLYGEELMSKFTMAPGFKVELFASEKEFPNLANPVQMSFDNKGRLWVACMPSYPHYKPGDQRPNDKLIILEDTNNDGKADKETVFADKLHLPIGFEFAPEGVYISQSENLKLLIDSNGDDKADKEEIILSGFDDHDTHHAISAFCADPSGALLMLEGIFLHTNVETAYGTVRASNGGMYRYNPTRRHLERYAQIPIPNPWGLAYDDWGQDIFAETSGPDVRWLMPSSIKPVYGIGSPKSPALVEEKYRVRPTSGLEFVSSRHFPDCMQSDFLINNTIGFLGMKQHKLWDDSTGYKSAQRQDLIKSTDPNFRPVDMEFAPDGSLYLIDWHNVLIGHMQHNARDPLRDHVHGKVYRITCEGRPLVTPAKVHGASIEELLDNLKLPEYRTRYRTKRELRGRDAVQVLKATKDWVAKLDPRDKNYERYLLEALWVTWGMNKVDHDILKKAAAAKDFRVRAAVVNVIRYMYHQIPDYKSLLEKMANDDHGRVRLASVVAGSWMDKSVGTKILDIAEKKPIDRWMAEVYASVKANFASRIKKLAEGEHENDVVSGLKGNDLKLLQKGRTLYGKEGNCVTCHQIDGNGLPSSGFPPLAASEWIKDEKKLVQVTLNGLMGPISVKGQKYEGRVPMMAYGKLMTDEDIAAIATYVRRSWGNREPPVQPETVAKIRKETASKQGYYQGSELQ